MPEEISRDPLLSNAPERDGYKVLPPCVLYERVGAGGMGTVYRGKHLRFGFDVAVKCLNPSLAAPGSPLVARFLREARIAADIHHQNLVQVYDVLQASGVHYLVMEYVLGETARQRVERKGPLSEAEACRILFGAASGLAAAHRKQIVHRDVKPDNILVGHDGGVKVSDLGLAKALENDEAHNTLTHGGAMGTPQYMAPEQWDDAAHVGPTADVWALGAVLYFLLSGANAIHPGSMPQICRRIRDEPFPDVRIRVPSISAEVASILAKCVQRDPALRYANCGELARDLQRLSCLDGVTALEADSGSQAFRAPLVSPPPESSLARIRLEFQADLSTPTPTLVHAPKSPERSSASTSSSNTAAAPEEPRAPVAKREAAPARQRRIGLFVALAVLAIGALIWGLLALRPKRDVHAEQAAVTPVQPPPTAPSASDVSVTDPTPAPQDQASAPPVSPAPEPPVVVPPTPPPVLELDEQGTSDQPRFVDASTYAVSGRVEHASELAILVNGQAAPEPRIDEHGRFAQELELPSDDRYEVLVQAPGSDTFESTFIVRDTTEPTITPIDPSTTDVLSRLKQVQLAVRVDDANIASVSLADGRALTRYGDTANWELHDLELDEGDNRLTVEAVDLAGNRAEREFAWRVDTAAPTLTRTEPAQDVVLRPASPFRLTLTFGEPLGDASVNDTPAEVRGDSALASVELPATQSTLRIRWRATDRAGNPASGELDWSVDLAPRVPEGFERVGEELASNGWARRIRDPRSGIVFVLVDAGTLPVDAPLGEGAVIDPFYVSDEVSRAQWRAHDALARAKKQAPMRDPSAEPFDPNAPVNSVSWNMAQQYCALFGYRLPTSLEWEYCCRAGKSTRYFFGDKLTTEQANIARSDHDLSGRAQRVDDGEVNDFGLRHMHGNVREWCSDVVRGPSSSTECHAVRGGSFFTDASRCGCAYVQPAASNGSAKDLGFRVVFSVSR